MTIYITMEEIIEWLKDLHLRLKVDITASIINSLPFYERKYTLKDLYTHFGSFVNALRSAGLYKITQVRIDNLPKVQEIVDWLKEVDKEHNITITTLAKLPDRKYNIKQINYVFGCLSAAMSEAGLFVYNERVNPKTLVDSNTTDIYNTKYPNITINSKKRSKICTYLRRKYNIDAMINHYKSSKDKYEVQSSKYTGVKYIYKYYDTMLDAYNEAGVEPHKYKLIEYLWQLYNSTGEPITVDNIGIKLLELNKEFGSLFHALNEAGLTDMHYECTCYVCKKLFASKSISTLCNGCTAIHNHSAIVNKNIEKSIKHKTSKHVKFVRVFSKFCEDNNIEVLTWDKYFNYNGVIWDCTIVLPQHKCAIYWYNTKSKYNPSHRFRKWLITKQYKYKLICIEEDKDALFTSVLIKGGIKINNCVKISEIMDYLMLNTYIGEIKTENIII